MPREGSTERGAVSGQQRHTAERSSETVVETVIPDTKDFKLRPAGSSQKWPQPPFPNALPFFLFTSAKSSYSVSCV